MFVQTRTVARKSCIALAALSLAAGAVCTVVRAQDMKMGDMKMNHDMPMSADDKKMMMDHMDKMKSMAADPSQADTMKMGMAKMMVMDHMAKMMAEDPDFQKAAMDMMNDPTMKQMHEGAMTMAKDPDQMMKMKQDIMADPKAMGMVDHMAMKMTMMHGSMGEMGGKMMDKMDDKMK